jgi:hypothetical protein
MAEEDAKARPLRFAWYGRRPRRSSSSQTLHTPRSERREPCADGSVVAHSVGVAMQA